MQVLLHSERNADFPIYLEVPVRPLVPLLVPPPVLPVPELLEPLVPGAEGVLVPPPD